MAANTFNRRKIINDPVHGFITIPTDLIYSIIETPCFQRLRRVKQLGLTHLVYPGAMHTRFHHVLGAMHLMGEAVNVLRSKGHEITEEEDEAVLIAILLHDIGHGPYSHVLENSLVQNVSHETISLLIMKKLNQQFNGALDMAIQIFTNKYSKAFLHQLVSSQLDTDRLDYLKRDSFFTGVSEGVISSDRIIKMLNVVNDELVIDAKGIYSIEKFLIARRLMYWQVYLHKTVIVAESTLVNVLKRASVLMKQGVILFGSDSLKYFLSNNIGIADFERDDIALSNFLLLDDDDVMCAIKNWTQAIDPVLSRLAKEIINRNLNRIILNEQRIDEAKIHQMQELCIKEYQLNNKSDAEYFVYSGTISNHTYSIKDDKINILYYGNQLVDISEASDMLNLSVLSKKVEKHFFCYPKSLTLK